MIFIFYLSRKNSSLKHKGSVTLTQKKKKKEKSFREKLCGIQVFNMEILRNWVWCGCLAGPLGKFLEILEISWMRNTESGSLKSTTLGQPKTLKMYVTH